MGYLASEISYKGCVFHCAGTLLLALMKQCATLGGPHGKKIRVAFWTLSFKDTLSKTTFRELNPAQNRGVNLKVDSFPDEFSDKVIGTIFAVAL